jgi:hypothetical protein
MSKKFIAENRKVLESLWTNQARRSFTAVDRQSATMAKRGIYGNFDTVEHCANFTRYYGDPVMGIEPRGTFINNRFAWDLYG